MMFKLGHCDELLLCYLAGRYHEVSLQHDRGMHRLQVKARSETNSLSSQDKTYKKVLNKFIIYFLWSVVTMVAAKCSGCGVCEGF